MSPSQKLAELRQKLERWKSHNEVHAKPADAVLYEFLSDLLKLADYEEEPALPEEVVPIVRDLPPTPPEVPQTINAEGGEGGNSPSNPPDLP